MNNNCTKNGEIENALFENCSGGIKLKIEDTEWYTDLKMNLKTGISNSFIITGNIHDYAIPGFLLEEYLIAKLVSDFNIKEICTLDYVFVNKFHAVEGPENLNIFENRINNAVDILKRCYGEEHKKALILRYPEIYMPNANETQMSDQQKKALVNIHNLIMDESFRKNGNILILLSETKIKLNQALFSSSCRAINLKIKYPNLEEREKMIFFLNEKGQVKFTLKDLTNYSDVASITGGMTRRNLEDIWRKATLSNEISLTLIRDIKKETLSKEFENYLEIVEPNEKYGLNNFGGMDCVKKYLKEGIINPIKEGNFEIIPKGLMFMGPPGTGKTFLAKCIANESGISFAEIKASKFLSKWVGETEQNIEKIFNCIDSLSPVFVFIDEIDQAIQRGNDDSNGVRANVFQMIVNYMSKNENRGNVIWIAATNYPNKVDEALKRAGRFDIKFVFSPPINKEEIKEVFKCQLQRIKYQHNINLESEKFNEILDMISDYTQAEIESIIVKALSLSRRRKIETVGHNEIIEAIKYLKRSENSKTREMLELAIEECNDLEFLPPELYERYCNSNFSEMNDNISNRKDSNLEFLYNENEKILLSDEEIQLIFKNRMENTTQHY